MFLSRELRARPYDASELKLGRCCQGPLGACREALKLRARTLWCGARYQIVVDRTIEALALQGKHRAFWGLVLVYARYYLLLGAKRLLNPATCPLLVVRGRVCSISCKLRRSAPLLGHFNVAQLQTSRTRLQTSRTRDHRRSTAAVLDARTTLYRCQTLPMVR